MFEKTNIEYSKSVKALLKEWLRKDEYSRFNLKSFEEILELVGINDAIKIDLIDKTGDSINCITREGKSFLLKLKQNENTYLVNLQIDVNDKKGKVETFDIKTYQDKKLKTNIAVNLIRLSKLGNQRALKFSIEENREVEIYVNYESKIGIDIAIYGNIKITKELKDLLVDYLSNVSIDLKYIDPKPIYEKISKIFEETTVEDTSKKQLEIIVIINDLEKDDKNIAKIYIDSENIKMYGICKDNKVFKAFINKNWEYSDCKRKVSYDAKEEMYKLSVKIDKKEKLKNISLNEIEDIEKQINELFEFF